MSASATSLNDTGLGSYVASAVESIRALHIMVTSLATALTAMRRMLLEELGFAEEYQEQLRIAAEATRPLLEDAMITFEKVIDHARP
jgi:hypothetical protein